MLLILAALFSLDILTKLLKLLVLSTLCDLNERCTLLLEIRKLALTVALSAHSHEGTGALNALLKAAKDARRRLTALALYFCDSRHM